MGRVSARRPAQWRLGQMLARRPAQVQMGKCWLGGQRQERLGPALARQPARFRIRLRYAPSTKLAPAPTETLRKTRLLRLAIGPLLRRALDRLANPLICATAAEIAGHGRVDVGIAGVWVLCQEGRRMS